ncbi:MAG: SIR2 family protein [Ignavibacteriaceae bacterium]|nr:SIR2 family protein [Ignavibacteriaceae bacterium]
MNNYHDPREFIRGLQQILISDSKRIGFLCGAGTSMAAEMRDKDGKVVYQDEKKIKAQPLIPGIKKMTENIINNIEGTDYKAALAIIKEELEEAEHNNNLKLSTFMLENIISSINLKIKGIGRGNLCGLNKEKLISLRDYIQKEIKKVVSVHDNPKIKLQTEDFLYSTLATWIINASRKDPVEIFTTNYDYLFEIGFESRNLPYFDGFVGSYNPFFDPVSVENDLLIPQWTRLWKLHGSLGWEYDKDEKKIIRSRKSDDDGIVIYPSLLKYDDSRKQPYVSYLDRLCSFIKKDDGVLFICGYSFGDEHINEAIVNSLSQSKSSTVYAFIYDNQIDENSPVINVGKRSKKMQICANKVALIGGVFGDWKLKREPAKEDFDFIDQYFDRDAPIPLKDKGKNDEQSVLTGLMKLTDFKQFTSFLLSLTYPSNTENDNRKN